MCNYDPQPGDAFTRRELDIYKRMVDGLTHKEIALSCFITERTSKFHCNNILKKTGMKSRLKLIVAHYKKEIKAQE